MSGLVLVNVMRYTILTVSITVLSAHVLQCFLFSKYQEKTHIPGWFSARHWQYFIWYISLSTSILSSVAICVHASCYQRSHILRGDRWLSIVNTVFLGANILWATLSKDQEPWTNGIVVFKEPSRGFISYCCLLNRETDATYPLLYQRCILWDAVWIGTIALCSFWALLIVFTIIIKPRRK